MDMNLQSLTPVCFVSGRPFEDGERVASYLVRLDPKSQSSVDEASVGETTPAAANATPAKDSGKTGGAGEPEIVRYDLLASEVAGFSSPGRVICRWVQVFKPRRQVDNPERELKLTAETLFLSLADAANAESPETEQGATGADEGAENNIRMMQVLALMLERKRVLRPKGASADGLRAIYEHAKSKQLYEVPKVTDLSPEFFLSIQEQLAALVGGNVKTAAAPATPPPAETTTETASPKAAGENQANDAVAETESAGGPAALLNPDEHKQQDGAGDGANERAGGEFDGGRINAGDLERGIGGSVEEKEADKQKGENHAPRHFVDHVEDKLAE